MALGEHGGHWIPFGREVEEGEIVLFGIDITAIMAVDGGMFVFEGVFDQLKILESEGFGEVELGVGARVGGVAVVVLIADIGAFRGECDVVGIGGGAHGEHEATADDVFLDFFGDSQFELRNLLEPMLMGDLFGEALVFAVPFLGMVAGVELAVLAGKVFVVEVEPIVFGEFIGQHFVVVNFVERDFGIGEHQGDGVVPRLYFIAPLAFELVGGGIDGDFWGFFELDRVHVHLGLSDLIEDLVEGRIGDDLVADAPGLAFFFKNDRVREGKAAAPVIEQPVSFQAILQSPVSDTISF